jgi:hypothetical protein
MIIEKSKNVHDYLSRCKKNQKHLQLKKQRPDKYLAIN